MPPVMRAAIHTFINSAREDYMDKSKRFIGLRRIVGIAAAVALAMPSFAFAAVHDPVGDISSDTATITLGKILTVNQENKFPNINDFQFEIEAVTAWDNANVDTDENGAEIAAADMPMPVASDTAHHAVTVDGTTATVAVGDFRTGTASSGGVADTPTQKLRTTDVNIRFTKAGYYLYKVTEIGSSPDSVPGVTYDDNSYYIVVYVCNNTDADGNTTDGVYVHNITSYRNADGSDTRPDLSDIANVTDNGGTAAADNTIENYDKVGLSSSTVGTDGDGNATGPDKLAAYRFWNEQNTHDVVLTNNVTGNLGDVTKDFEFEVTISGLEKGVTYTTNVPTVPGDRTEIYTTSEGADIVSASVGTADPAAKTFTADADGNATLLVTLKDDEVFVMNALPKSAKYAVNERASDHVASYAVTSDSDDATITRDSDANQVDETALATAEETVDADDGTVVIAYTNHRDLATPTGIPRNAVPVAAFAVIAVGLAAVVRRRGSRVGE